MDKKLLFDLLHASLVMRNALIRTRNHAGLVGSCRSIVQYEAARKAFVDALPERAGIDADITLSSPDTGGDSL